MWPMHEFFGGGFWLFPLLFLLVMVVCVLRFGRMPGQAGTPKSGDSPTEIAKRRFAEGEISKDEFETIKRTIA